MPIERHGVDTIPEAERTSGPRDLVAILLGSNLCLGVIVFGWLPVSFGLGLWPAVTSVVAGTVLGVLVTAPLALVSLRTATNLSTSSGAFFGVRGRLVGSVVGLLLSLGYTALTLWIGGDVALGALARLLGVPTGGAAHTAVYALLAGCTVVAAVYGYRLLLRLSRVLAVGMTALLALGLVAYAGDFTAAAPPDAPYLLGSFWPTWLLSAVAAGLSGPVAFITLLGDYTRYVSPRRHNARTVWWATCAGLFLGLLVPQLFGTVTALAARAGADYAGPLVAAAPAWYLLPLLLAAGAGSVGNAGLMLYSMGLDLDAILPRATRTAATLVVAAVATAFVFLGHFAWDARSAMTSFVLLLTAVGTPWAVITLMGHVRCRGRYDAEALQVLNRRARGGAYWFRAGWHPGATAAWALGAAAGLAGVSTPVYEGPLLALTGGVDCGFVLSGVVGGVAYALLVRGGDGRPATTPDAGAAAPGAVPSEPDAGAPAPGAVPSAPGAGVPASGVVAAPGAAGP
ncbi:cytosine permease [Streptomyces sp. DH12]|uniref:cytosine permease n=1 Tax=Streptomyces sp. DH12 TaxID=2857010 RepID=UPI001E6432B8|nr:cytosine permease [Streptomyces sp. DH12]